MGEETTRALTAEDIAGANDLEIRRVEVPEWRGVVFLRSLPVDEAFELSRKLSALEKAQQHESVFILLAACICDEAGKRLLESDAPLRGRKPEVLLRLQQQALQLQGWEPVRV